MADLSFSGKVQTGFDEHFEDKWLRLELVVRTLMLVILGAGLLGAFGRGPLARASVQHGPVKVDFERLARFRTPTMIQVQVQNPPSGELLVDVTGELPSSSGIQRSFPDAVRSESLSNGARYRFAVAPGTSVATFMFAVEPEVAGFQKSRVEVHGVSQPVSLDQFIYP